MQLQSEFIEILGKLLAMVIRTQINSLFKIKIMIFAVFAMSATLFIKKFEIRNQKINKINQKL